MRRRLLQAPRRVLLSRRRHTEEIDQIGVPVDRGEEREREGGGWQWNYWKAKRVAAICRVAFHFGARDSWNYSSTDWRPSLLFTALQKHKVQQTPIYNNFYDKTNLNQSPSVVRPDVKYQNTSNYCSSFTSLQPSISCKLVLFDGQEIS